MNGSEQIVANGADSLLQYGALGIFCLFLIGVLWIVWRYLQKRDREFLKRTDKFTDVMKQHAINEVQQTEVLRGLKDVIQSLKLNSG